MLGFGEQYGDFSIRNVDDACVGRVTSDIGLPFRNHRFYTVYVSYIYITYAS